MDRWIEETFHPHWRVRLEASRVLHEVKTDHQHLVIFENPTWGTVLMLDGVCQLTTSDEFVYHEMMAHVPLMALERPKRVLIVGGGDGGVLREVLKHPSVLRATLCEIDRTVIDTARQHYPSIPGTAFEDKRTDLVIADGCKYVAETDERFDAIIVDRSRFASSDGNFISVSSGAPDSATSCTPASWQILAMHSTTSAFVRARCNCPASNATSFAKRETFSSRSAGAISSRKGSSGTGVTVCARPSARRMRSSACC